MFANSSRDRLVVIVSVDWEPDHGRWRCGKSEVKYGGILKGTAAFANLLDELAIPATWFIETSYDRSRDLPRLFPECVAQLANRKRDEIGLHIHWRKPNGDDSISYETSDSEWVAAQIDHGVRQLDTLGARPRAFRSGALLHISKLPRMLSNRGFLVDSSTLWGKACRLNSDKKHLEKKPALAQARALLHRMVAPIPRPYFTDIDDVEVVGASTIAEFPIAYSLFDTKNFSRRAFSRYLTYKASMTRQVQYLTLFFHIDELTVATANPSERTELNTEMVAHFRDHLIGLKKAGARFVTCSEARNCWLEEYSSPNEYNRANEGVQ